MTQMLLQEPGWKYERKGSALLLRRDSTQQLGEEEAALGDSRAGRRSRTQRVCFRCDVEVREFERDEDYPGAGGSYYYEPVAEPEVAASPLAMCASCLAALCVTVVLPWLLIGG